MKPQTVLASLVLLTSTVIASTLASTAAAAQSYLDPGASAEQVKRALTNTRSIRPHRPSQAAPLARRGQTPPRAYSPAAAATGAAQPLPPSEGDVDEGPASFRIQFELGSAALRSEAIPLLNALGEALMSDELRDWTFVVEGHTDASGSEQLNLALSQQRAEAVRDYLVSKYRIAPERLPAQGYGETKLYDPARPTAAINRRVAFSAPQSAAEMVTDAARDEVAANSAVAVSDATAASNNATKGDELVIDTFIETGPAPVAPASAPAPTANGGYSTPPAEQADGAS